ncbi:hypothetical protein [Bradyrhizobium erythrophlei]|uniref:PLD-like domain-containing protein n=1 Tax=Bradyrhizobium erythrophlei TaxID=1437360 RepID=A0A1M5KAM9_9BRAD|nr:hypothetical protein [Bradyrhizobium erythrophlei]SHG49788.1 PLD-like domain-containing protein [Bradyrhizobium erythrophlei]
MAKKAAVKKASKKAAPKKASPRKTPAAAATPVSPPVAAPVAAAPMAVVATPEAELTPPKSTVTNAIDLPSVSLQRFDLTDLQPYTQEKVYATTASKDFHLFYVGRDDVHSILKHVLSRVSVSLYLNMFGFDDDELNEILKKIAMDKTITMLVTLDKSQASGTHEKALLDADRKLDLALFNTHVAIGQSLTHQISHTKGFVADGKVAGEGSTNWSASGEGAAVGSAFNVKAKGYKAQNNTQSIITDQDTISRFTAELIAEHMIAQAQNATAQTAKAVKAAARK